ncbi:putative wall-associated receptor kinase-like 16 isoform X1 [Panicum miliaceum]|uniref:Wall-associated receptor kinase-like 16 isoform X1 n=1 Tax=Panicum miliaceum TaxID=4540 RepID=A0A3L6TB93_PANMI|nr:putative wall-associated receptor kinase-like 16 isoform X1 [Panicum miliaceum]
MRSRCGDVDIPYPFGIGDQQCAINPFFHINCTSINGAERPLKGPFELTKIYVPDAKAWMKMGISWQCGLEARQSVWFQNFTHTPFRFSNVDNKIVVVGCNTLAYMKSEPHIVGCYATCSVDSIPKNGSCTATAGCCEAGVPEDLGYCEAYFNKNYNTSKGCGYIVVIEEKAFSYSTTYADQTKTEFWDAYKGQVPFVMDWVITRDDACNVSTTTNHSPYACLSNDSHCVSSTNGRGIRCK